jgi:DeoR family suf operon transcriptional repressor
VLYCSQMPSETRELTLRTLRARGRCTIKELAQIADVSPVSVRHHLASLQSEGLVRAEEERHGVGRPRLVYSLTNAALELFPTRYFRLTNLLLEEIKEAISDQQIQRIFSAVAAAMAREYASRLQDLPLHEKLKRLEGFLKEEGFEAELEMRGDLVFIREYGCPYLRLGQQHPEVCLIDQAFIATALSLPVARVSCLLEGDHRCTFTIDLRVSPEAASGAA